MNEIDVVKLKAEIDSNIGLFGFEEKWMHRELRPTLVNYIIEQYTSNPEVRQHVDSALSTGSLEANYLYSRRRDSVLGNDSFAREKILEKRGFYVPKDVKARSHGC